MTDRTNRPAEPPERKCPGCGAFVTPIPIVYGYPSPELFEEADAGSVRLGGCVVSDDDPQYACPAYHEPLLEDSEPDDWSGFTG